MLIIEFLSLYFYKWCSAGNGTIADWRRCPKSSPWKDQLPTVCWRWNCGIHTSSRWNRNFNLGLHERYMHDLIQYHIPIKVLIFTSVIIPSNHFYISNIVSSSTPSLPFTTSNGKMSSTERIIQQTAKLNFTEGSKTSGNLNPPRL